MQLRWVSNAEPLVTAFHARVGASAALESVNIAQGTLRWSPLDMGL